MRIRSLPHFAHSPIGKTTHKKSMSYAHVNYITRDDACSKTLADNMPADRDGARPYFQSEASKDGVAANARIADTLIIALPLELTAEQRHEAIQNFMEKIGKGRIAWLAAVHDKGKDEANPHCHIIFRDADIETGRKVVGTTTSAKDVKEAQEHGWRVPPRMTTKDLRIAWCEHLNAEMERHGLDVRFDHRSLKEQGIDREPEIHVGPKAHSMAKKDRDFFSQDRRRGNHANVYTLLDAGSRADHNQRIVERNRERETRRSTFKGDPREDQEKSALRAAQSTQRKAMYADQTRDRTSLRAAQDAEKLAHQRWARAHYAKAREIAFQEVKQRHADSWRDTRRLDDAKRRQDAVAASRDRQKKDYAQTSAKHVEAARPDKDAAWQALKDTQEAGRQQMKQRHAEETTALSRQHISERHALHERWQDLYRQKQAQRIDAKLQSNQSMPSVQANAVNMIKLHRKATRTIEENGYSTAMSPHAASQLHAERSRAEAANRVAIRYELNKVREDNLARASARSDRHHGGAGRAATGTPRRASRSAETQKAIQQAAQSGRALSDAERANAAPATKHAIAGKERDAQTQRTMDLFSYIQQRPDKGRSGGRSGR